MATFRGQLNVTYFDIDMFPYPNAVNCNFSYVEGSPGVFL